MKTNFNNLANESSELYNLVLDIEENIGLDGKNFATDMRRVIEGYIEFMWPEAKRYKQLGEKITYLEDQQLVSNNTIQNVRTGTKTLNNQMHYSPEKPKLNYSQRINLLNILHILVSEHSSTDEFDIGIYQNYELELFDSKSKANEYFAALKSNLENGKGTIKNCDIFANFCAAHLMDTDDVLYSTRVKFGLEEDGINQFFYDDDNDSFKIGKSFYDNNTTSEQIKDSVNQIKMTLQVFAENNDYKKSEAFSHSKDEFCDQIESCDNLDIYIFSMTKLNNKIFSGYNNNVIKEIKDILKDLNDDLNIAIHIIGYDEIIKYFEEIDTNNGVINQELKLVNKESIIKIPDAGFYMCVIKGKSLKKLFDNHQESLFEKNVRGYIKNKKIDTEITSTIKSRPKDFLILNNGITIVAKHVEHDGVLVKFDEMFIVNGAQTTSLIGRSDSTLDDLLVLTKIIEVNDEKNWDDLTNKISEASNNQKPIKPIDLLSSNKFIRKFADNLKQQDSEWRLLYKRSDLMKQLVAKDKLHKVNLEDLIKIYLSFVLQKPGTARNKFKSFISSSSTLIDAIFKKWDLKDSNNYQFFQDIMTLNDLYEDSVKKYKKEIGNSTVKRDTAIYNCLANGKHVTLSFIGMIIMYNSIKTNNYDFSDMSLLHTKIKFGPFIKKDEFDEITSTTQDEIYNVFIKFAEIASEKVAASGQSATNNFKSDDFYKLNLQTYIVENFGAKGLQVDIEKISNSIFTNLSFK
jgi:hypothetical protein